MTYADDTLYIFKVFLCFLTSCCFAGRTIQHAQQEEVRIRPEGPLAHAQDDVSRWMIHNVTPAIIISGRGFLGRVVTLHMYMRSATSNVSQ